MTYRLLLSGALALAFLLLPGAPALAASTWYVDGVHGSDTNSCASRTSACKTIGHAIALAASGDTIIVAAATYTENLTIPISLTIKGAGAKTTIIDGGKTNEVVGIFFKSSTVTVVGVTIRNGWAIIGGGIDNVGTLTIRDVTFSGNTATSSGGGIFNAGTLTIAGSTLSGNSAGLDGGGIYNSGTVTIANSTLSANSALNGGGIENDGPLTMTGSTLSGNSAPQGGGGGIDNVGTLTITDSTLSGNSAGNGGGVNGGGTIAIASSTLSGNSATNPVFNIGGGILINTPGLATLQNTIVANSPSGGNCYGIFTTQGYNLSSDGSCPFSGPGDLNNIDPMLGPLQNNGGPTQTQALLAGSPAIDAGNPAGCTDATGKRLMKDQRGQPRPDPEDAGIGCDIGAYESQTD